MKITDITPQKHNKERVSVFVDGEYAFSLEGVDAIKHGLKIGLEITDDDRHFYLKECNHTKARNIAMDMVSRKPVSKKMVIDKLIEKGYDRETVDGVIDELEGAGILDDLSYGHLYLEYAKEKCWGERRIRYELSQKGLDNETINDILSDANLCGIEDLTDLLKQKYPREDFADIKVRQRASRYLASRGFDFPLINEAISILKNTDKEGM